MNYGHRVLIDEGLRARSGCHHSFKTPAGICRRPSTLASQIRDVTFCYSGRENAKYSLQSLWSASHHLNNFFGDKTVSELKAQLCRDFVDWSTGSTNDNTRNAGIEPRSATVSDQTARRRLEDLRAAVNAYHAEHTLSVVPKITLPPKAEGRHRWLTRTEAARRLGAAIGYVWDTEQSTWKRREDGTLVRRERWIIRRRYPAARFCLVVIYSARREETIRRTQWLPTTTHPWMNLEAMVYQGKGALERSTKKRRPPAKIASRLRPHPVRWRRIDHVRSAELGATGVMREGEQIRFVVNRIHDGQPLAGKIGSAWEGILEDAGLGDDVVRHSLRHTAATWLMQAGVDMWEAAGWLGMTVEQLEANYGHHHPDFQEEAAEAFGGRR